MTYVYAVTVLGHDRPGIIADVTGGLALLGGNLEDSSMTLLRGHFAMTLIVRVDASLAEVEEGLSFLAQDDLTVSVLPVKDETTSVGPSDTYLLSVHGADRPGIVSAITALVAVYGGNIVDLTTRLGTNLYLLTAMVELRPGTDVTALVNELKETAHTIGVEVSLTPSDVDTL